MGKAKAVKTAALKNRRAKNFYFKRMKELAISRFKWENLPDTVSERYLELSLFEKAAAIYFKDEVMGDLCLTYIQSGKFDVYGDCMRRRAYSMYSNYQKELTYLDSVIIWNNELRIPTVEQCEFFAEKLWNIDRMIDINLNAQKTPLLIQCTEKQRLSMENLFMQYDGNMPVIVTDQLLGLDNFKVLSTKADFIADRLMEAKERIWSEFLTFLGYSNISIQKKERLITEEVKRNMGGIIGSRYSPLEEREKAADQINRMFGTNIRVRFREDMDELDTDRSDLYMEEGDDDE